MRLFLFRLLVAICIATLPLAQTHAQLADVFEGQDASIETSVLVAPITPIESAFVSFGNASGFIQSLLTQPAISPQENNLVSWGNADATIHSIPKDPFSVPNDISIEIKVPQELSINESGWYAENPSELKVTMTNNTQEIFFGRLEITFSDSERLVFDDGDPLPVHAPSELRSFIGFPGLDPGASRELVWPMWVQPMSEQPIVFTAQALDNIPGELKGQGTATMVVPTANIHPVVVIPGILGSWKNFQGEWQIDPLTGRYNNLLNELRLAGYEDNISLFTFPYDWRQHISISGFELSQAIPQFLSQTSSSAREYIDPSRIDIVAHSMGGLVSRSYIQGGSYGNNVNRLITLGTPHRGSPKAYLRAEGLEFADPDDPIAEAIVDTVFRELARKNGYCTYGFRLVALFDCWVTDADLYRYIKERVFSVREQFPDESYLKNDGGGYLVDSRDPTSVYPFGHYENTFLDLLNGNIISLITRLGGENVIAVIGIRTDPDTDILYRVVERRPEDIPLWGNGKVKKDKQFRIPGQGDLLVPSISANLGLIDERVQINIAKSGDNGSEIVHGHLPTQLQKTIADLLTKTRPFFSAGYFDPPIRNLLVFYNLSPVEMQVIDSFGRRAGLDFETGSELNEIPGAFFSRSNLPNEPDFIFVPEPSEGEYKIKLKGIAAGIYIVGANQLTDTGTLTVSEFSGSTFQGATHEHALIYDPQSLPLTPLTLTWHPPLDNLDRSLLVSQTSTLPVKFTIRDAHGVFVASNTAFVWIGDPKNPSSVIAAFSQKGPGLQGKSDTLRIDPTEEQYILNLQLENYNLQPNKLYTIGIGIFGQQISTNSFVVTPTGKK